jgi:hypothetical protein
MVEAIEPIEAFKPDEQKRHRLFRKRRCRRAVVGERIWDWFFSSGFLASSRSR